MTPRKPKPENPWPFVLDRPLLSLDLETTSARPWDARIVEIGIYGIFPNGDPIEFCQRIDPMVPIEPGATKAHGISDDDIRDLPRFVDVAADLTDLVSGADVVGYNLISFDIPVLSAEYRRIGHSEWFHDWAAATRFIDAFTIFRTREPRTLEAAHARYVGPEYPGKTHSAIDDARATLEVLRGQLKAYPDIPLIPRSIAEMFPSDRVDVDGKFKKNGAGETVVGFGKHNGKLLSVVVKEDQGWLEWVAGPKTDFAPDTKRIAREAIGKGK